MKKPPHWLRERTAEERAWERAWRKKMEAYEQAIMRIFGREMLRGKGDALAGR